MKNKDFLSILDLGDGEVDGIISKAASIKRGNTPQILSGKTVALIFEKKDIM